MCVYFPDLNLFNLESLSQLVIEHGLRLNRNKWLASIVLGRFFQMLLIYVIHKEGSESPLFVKCFLTTISFWGFLKYCCWSFFLFFFFKHRKIFLTLIIFGTQQSYLLHQFLISFTFICQFFVPVNSRFVCKQTLNNLNCESDIPVFFFFNFYFTDWKVVGRHFSQLWIEKWKFRDLHNFIGRNLGLSTGSVKETS